MQNLDYWQGARYRFGQRKGHYESWFLRANHPARDEAFWIRYTIFSPRGRPDDAIGELWAIHSGGETGKVRAAKSEIPAGDCYFAPRGLDIRIGSATLKSGKLCGEARRPHNIRWNLDYRDGGPPMLFLPEKLYEAAFPKAKALSQRPHVVFTGTLEIDGENITINNWVGSENHNWGSKHTDTYAWGQVVGFDNAPDAFLECATVRLRFGPLWSPPLTMAVLRIDGLDYKVNSLVRAFRAIGRWGWKDGAFDWRFDARDDKAGTRICGHLQAKGADFVGLTYYNPPGGSHTCLNSKIAACEVTLERAHRPPLTLATRHRAAFEILTDDTGHDIAKAT
ncbi:MAG: hypothetical protein WBX25_09395 [Rhodomicrobium sp.]